MGSTLFIHSPELNVDGYPPTCPFNSSRAGRTYDIANSMGMFDGNDRTVRAPDPLNEVDLLSFHTPAYIDALKRAGHGTITPDEALAAGLGTPDCPIFKNMYEYLVLAAGGTLTGARAILSGEAHVAFNPSGGFHHAQPGHAAGFCYLNDVNIAINALTSAGKRVLFLDIDVHHCDGVQDAYYTRSDVMTVSLHESGRTLFPGTGFEDETGAGQGAGYTLNIPLPVGTYDAIYEEAMTAVVYPAISRYDPDIIVLELGMDTLAGDPLAHLHLTNNVPAHVTEHLLETGKPILATGGGGYNVDNTVRSWALCWSVLCGDHSRHDELMVGMGGVMMENTDWVGGLRDRMLVADGGRRSEIDTEIRRVIEALKATLPC